ncbi:hypothetical protein SNEBB_009663 [Seison nebaliae]|nr:hypothetical protein SNEBB_009663 [Seison nebaliae]
MSGIYHRPRDGVRGGHDRFDWKEVVDDKDRECYLGHSLKAPKGRDAGNILWYEKEKKKNGRTNELRDIKDEEDKAMAMLLNIPVGHLKKSNQNLDKTKKRKKRKKLEPEEEEEEFEELKIKQLAKDKFEFDESSQLIQELPKFKNVSNTEKSSNRNETESAYILNVDDYFIEKIMSKFQEDELKRIL